MPKVSVLIPCYQSAAYIRRAVESVLAQTFQDWELVIIDNASEDGTFEIATGYAAQDARIRTYRNAHNLGPVKNWRRCVAEAHGEYAALLFSDDWYEPQFIETALRYLESDAGAGIAYSAVTLVAGGGGASLGAQRVCYELERSGMYPSHVFASKALETRGGATPVSPGCALMRRGDLQRWLGWSFSDEGEIGYLRHGAGPDLAIYLQAVKEYPRFAHIRTPLANFLSHDANLSRRPDVAVAYARATVEVFEAGEPWDRVDAQRMWANLAVELRGTAQLIHILGKLRLRGWRLLAARVLRWGARSLGARRTS